jgi:hypothetical protein
MLAKCWLNGKIGQIVLNFSVLIRVFMQNLLSVEEDQVVSGLMFLLIGVVAGGHAILVVERILKVLAAVVLQG